MVNPGTERARSRRSRAPLSSMTVLGNGSDGSRRVDKRFGQLARSGLLHLVGCVWIGIGVGAGRGCWRRSRSRCDRSGARFLGGSGGRLLLRLLGFDVERRQRRRWGRRLSQRDAGGTGGGKARGRQQARGRHFFLGRSGAGRLAQRTAQRSRNSNRTHTSPQRTHTRTEPKSKTNSRGWLGLAWLPRDEERYLFLTWRVKFRGARFDVREAV